jgi:acetoin utilization protein AcuB
MYVGRRMTRKVIAMSPKDTVRDANRVLQENRIHHLPVIEGGELVGIVSDTDLRKWVLGEEMINEGGTVSRRTGLLEEVMTRDVITMGPEDTIEDALLTLHKKRFGALPVVEGRKLVGIITKADILAAFVDTLRIEGVGGVRIEVILPRDASFLLRLIGKLEEMKVEIRSLVLSPFRGEFVAFLRIGTIDVAKVKSGLQASGFTVPALEDFLG